MFFAFAVSLHTTAQYRPAGNDLWCMEFFDDANGITIGGSGTIRQTSDGGLNWTDRTSGTINTLKKTAILTDENIVVVGTRGTILKTTDHGETWSSKSSGLNLDLYGISFGGRLSEVGIAVGDNGTILRSTDQGETWSALTIDINVPKQTNYRSVAFGSENNGVIVGQNGALLLTSNGGITWYNSPSIIPNVNFVFAIMVDENTAFATGENGMIIKTINMGESWETIATGVNNTLYRIRFADDQNAISVGTEGTILRTTDGGLNWTNETSGISNNLNCLFVVDDQISYTGGTDGIILKTTDGGTNWFQQGVYSSPVNGFETKEIKLSVYPNPSNPYSVINYKISDLSFVTIKIFDILGKELKVLVNEVHEKGKYSVSFDGTKLSSGMYFCKMMIQNDNGITAKTMKIILVK
jgi:photosystem II stability/assembly factor-like uncharacterized protein